VNRSACPAAGLLLLPDPCPGSHWGGGRGGFEDQRPEPLLFGAFRKTQLSSGIAYRSQTGGSYVSFPQMQHRLLSRISAFLSSPVFF